MDVELALERTLVYEYLLLNAGKIKMHRKKRKSFSIPGLFVSPYVVDFGSVILGNTVQYTISIFNYGPCPSSIRLLDKDANSKKAKDKGICN